MSVESSNNKLRQKADGDVNKRVKGALQQKREAVEPELERIRQKLIQQRTLRDTTNHPSAELASNNKGGAIQRRLNKTSEPRSDGRGNRGNSGKASSGKSIARPADSGAPDDASMSIAGADTSGGGTNSGGSV